MVSRHGADADIGIALASGLGVYRCHGERGATAGQSRTETSIEGPANEAFMEESARGVPVKDNATQGLIK
jgi:hypothetical protein